MRVGGHSPFSSGDDILNVPISPIYRVSLDEACVFRTREESKKHEYIFKFGVLFPLFLCSFLHAVFFVCFFVVAFRSRSLRRSLLEAWYVVSPPPPECRFYPVGVRKALTATLNLQ